MNKTFAISDDSGFIGIINVGKYNAFVKEDWQFNDLRQRFIREMNRASLLLWSTGLEGVWNVRIATASEADKPFRTIKGFINVTEGELFLINYEDLSMAAMYEDEELPQPHNADLKVQIENGAYSVIVNQLFDPEKFIDDEGESLHFEIILGKVTEGDSVANKFEEIPWMT